MKEKKFDGVAATPDGMLRGLSEAESEQVPGTAVATLVTSVIFDGLMDHTIPDLKTIVTRGKKRHTACNLLTKRRNFMRRIATTVFDPGEVIDCNNFKIKVALSANKIPLELNIPEGVSIMAYHRNGVLVRMPDPVNYGERGYFSYMKNGKQRTFRS